MSNRVAARREPNLGLPVTSGRRRRLASPSLAAAAAAAVLASVTSAARAQSTSLVVDSTDGNVASPYSPTTDATYTGGIVVGDVGTGVLNQSTNTLTNIGQNIYVGNQASGVGTYNLTGTATLVANSPASQHPGFANPQGNALNVGYGGIGTVNQSGASSVILGTDTLFLGGSGQAASPNNGSGTYIIGGSATLTTGSEYLGTQFGSTGTFVQTGGTVTVSTSDQFGTYIGDVGIGIFNMSGGSYTAYSTIVGEVASGTINQTGGTFNAGQSENTTIGTATLSTQLAQQFGGQPVATLNLSGGKFISSAMYLGDNGIGVLNQNGSSSLTTQNQSAGSGGAYLPVYIAIGANGTWNLGGNANASIGTLYVGYTTLGIVNQTGGTLTTNTGTVVFPSRPSATGSTYNLLGGTLTTTQIGTALPFSAATTTFNFGGGILQASASTGPFTPFMSGLTAANVLAGGAKIDTQAFNISIAQPLLATPTSPGGGLTTLGTGTLTLTGASTYNGSTAVSSTGTLRVNGSLLSTGTVLVPAGGTLGGSGTVGAVTVAGTITAGADSVSTGTLTTGPETWNASGGLLAKVAGGANDVVVMTGLSVGALNIFGSRFNVTVTSSDASKLSAGSVLVLANDTQGAASNPFGPAFNTSTLSDLTLNVTGLQSATGGFALATQPDSLGDGGYDLILQTAAVPEPTSLLLLVASTGSLALTRRRRHR